MSTNIDPSQWRLRTAGGIYYKLVEGYPRGSFEEEDAEVEEKYIIQSADLDAFVAESLSEQTVYPGGTWFYRPARAFPGLSYLVCKKVGFEPFEPGKPSDPYGVDSRAPGSTYGQFVYVTVTYKGGKNDEDKDPEDLDLLEISCNGSGEFLVYQLPKGAVADVPADEMPSSVQGADGTSHAPTAEDLAKAKQAQVPPATIPLTKVLPGLEWSVKFPRVPRVHLPGAIATARSYLGCVNSKAMPIFYDAPAETILFMGFSMTLKRTWRDKQRFAQCDLKFSEKRINDGTGKTKGHNHFFWPATGTWVKLLRPDGKAVYDSENLNTLFNG